MSYWNTVKSWFGKTGVDVYDFGEYEIKNIGNLVVPEKLTNKNAFLLANSVSEIFFPIDFYADRISKIRFFIADKNGNEIQNSEFNRFIDNRINPLFTFSDLVYMYVFSMLSDGNAINYLGVPGIYDTVQPSTIERWDVLQPNLVEITELNGISYLNINSLMELVNRVYYNEGNLTRKPLDKNKVFIHSYGQKRRSDSNVLAQSPLFSANKSIDTLLSVYSARYNVYANNGAAGYLAKKSNTGVNANFEAAIMDGNQKQQILDDINSRNGLTGKRNIWGISGVPIEFVKTLATISELMPFDETLEDSIKIAAIFQIPSGLVPRKDQSTFDNQASNEQSIWENGLLNMTRTVCENLTKLFVLKKANVQILFDASDVSALVQNASEKEDLIQKKLNNLEKIKQLYPDWNIQDVINEIIKDYGT